MVVSRNVGGRQDGSRMMSTGPERPGRGRDYRQDVADGPERTDQRSGARSRRRGAAAGDGVTVELVAFAGAPALT
jgi:hypothetical protein